MPQASYPAIAPVQSDGDIQFSKSDEGVGNGEGMPFRDHIRKLSEAKQDELISDAERLVARRLPRENREENAHDFTMVAFIELWAKNKRYPKISAGLIADVAFKRFCSAWRRGHLLVKDPEAYAADHGESVDASLPVDVLLEKKQLCEMLWAKACAEVLTPEEIEIFEAFRACEAYRGRGIDNKEVAEILGEDVEYVSGKIEAARKRLRGRGFSVDAIL
jgi:hypothetical protein